MRGSFGLSECWCVFGVYMRHASSWFGFELRVWLCLSSYLLLSFSVSAHRTVSHHCGIPNAIRPHVSTRLFNRVRSLFT
ncbi:hypothetical protein CC80DRAFT_64678 [Byssothecium circinans]|uniref:Uncharacterized protein n=1 Tax=Byssothecium circinans TaxID=147558 RepID=A0A6A5TYF7_9PLEO|nr:hypothetical protein CC80DRAFT_64678 [Byssothecium circinans]